MTGLAISLGSTIWLGFYGGPSQIFGGFQIDLFTYFFTGVLLLVSLFVAISSLDFMKGDTNTAPYFGLLLLSTLGMIVLAASMDLILLYVGWELMSLPTYALTAIKKKDPNSNEAAVKFFVLSALSSALLVYAISLTFGITGSTSLPAIASSLGTLTGDTRSFALIAIVMFVAGFGVKMAVVPFHMWIPDVYQGSPTTVSGFMSTGAKAAAFSAFIIVFAHPQLQQHEQLRTVLAVISAASMILGNIVAITQSNIKRMLAYSSIAHAGYMLTGLAAANQIGRDGIVFYLIAYTFMNLGAFGVLSILEQEGERNLTFDDYAGLGTRRPFLAALMSVYMLSLAGIPPFAGFFGKYYVFAAALQSHLAWLAIVGVLTSVVSVYYYLRLVMVMYFQEGVMTDANAPSRISLATLAASAVMVTALGIYPSGILTIINNLP